ncbi:MAG: hypothetical protein KatS3mg020_1052 [Fimbriimonadales bacterium]|nr:MAG: hypothetical protein KatS3mg020_1052 [Fimbriimonadales bacterium]
MRCGWLLVWVCLYLASSGAQTILKASPLLDDDAATYRAVFKVELERRTSNTHGMLVLHDPVRGALLYSLDLAANARKQLYLSVSSIPSRASRRYHKARLEWRGADGERITTPLYPPIQTHLPIVVVGDMIGGLEPLNERKATFPSSILASGGFDVPLRVYYRRAAALPDAWQALLDLPVIVLVEGAETLSESQWRALRRWLAAGGSLVVSVGSFGAMLKATPLAELLPPIPLTDHAAGVASRPSEASGWQILTTDEAQRPILYHKRVGLGQLYLLMGDLEQPRWRNWSELPEIFDRVIRNSAGFPSERLRFDDNLSILTQQTRYKGNRWSVSVLLLYFLGVWGLTVSLRRRRRLSRVFAPLIALATIGSVAALVFAPRPSHTEPVLLSQTVLNETGEAIEMSYLYTTLSAGRHTLTLGAETETLTLVAKPNATVQMRLSSETPTLQIHCAALTHFGVCTLRPVADAPALKARWQGNRLQVHNLSNQQLIGVQIGSSDANGRSSAVLWEQRTLSAGAQAVISINPSHRQDGVRIWALYERTGAPAATLNGKPIQEVNTLFLAVP